MRSPSGRRTARPDITGSSATRGWPLMSAFGGLPGFSSDLPLLLVGPPEVEKLQVARVPMMGPSDRCRRLGLPGRRAASMATKMCERGSRPVVPDGLGEGPARTAPTTVGSRRPSPIIRGGHTPSCRSR